MFLSQYHTGPCERPHSRLQIVQQRFTRFLQALIIIPIAVFSLLCTTVAFAQDNSPPTSVAGADLQANEGDFILLDGSLSFDGDGDPITYSWTQTFGPAATSFTGTDTATPTVQVPSVGGVGATMTFQLTVCDPEPLCTSNSVNVFINPVANQPAVSCVGIGTGIFDTPMNKPVTVDKRARALPFSMTLIDEYGNALSDTDIAPPLIEVDVAAGATDSAPPPEVLDSAGKGDEGNQFTFNGTKWGFNLKTANFSGAGEYTVTVKSGDSTAYVVNPTCEGMFYILR